MSEEFTQASPGEEDMEIIEEDYIVEELDESIYTVDIKEEDDSHPDIREIFSDNNEYTHIVSLEKNENTGKEIYHCALCNVTFDSIENHLNEYHDRVKYEQEYDENIQMIVEEVEYEEDKSPEKQQDSEERGPAVDTETAEVVCQICDFVFNNLEDVESHQCKQTNLNNEPVRYNGKSVISEGKTIKTHQCQTIGIKKEFEESSFYCSQCPRIFASLNWLQQHQKTHKPSKPNKPKKIQKGKLKKTADSPNEISNEKKHCDICNTTFTSAKNLKLHAKMHQTIPTKTIKDAMPIGTDGSNNRNQFYCEICNKSFDHALLSIHQNMHQNFEEHNCSICNRQFENQVSYDMHMQLHADQPTQARAQQTAKPGARFACNYCGREFLRPHEKVKHERIHTGEKPHECEVCGKCFRVSYSLTLHLRTHTDIRPFVCAQCNKRFKAYAVYSHHLNTHSEERPYKCPMCPKSFRTSVQLCGHKNSHTKPYSCPECNRPFASLYAVKMHMKTHNKANKSNENLKHRCGTCGAVYARMFALRFHMKEQHSEDLTNDPEKNLAMDKKPPITADDCFNEDEISTQAIMSGEEIIIDNFHTEEIVTDWLTQK